VLIRTGRVLHLHLADGQLIRTTPEHPFWVEELGWTPADMLRAGMRLATLGGEWVSVEEAFDTGEYETVYNCRVAEYHTYFVGDDTHVLAVWAHNAYTYYIAEEYTVPGVRLGYTVFQKSDGQRVKDLHYTDFATALAAVQSTTDNTWETVRNGRFHSIELGPNFGWKGILQKFPKDARDEVKPDPYSYEMEYKTAKSNPSKAVYDAHAHHIVMEHGPETHRSKVRRSQAILRQYKIDPYFSRENLVWAPNYHHAHAAYALAVHAALTKPEVQTRNDVITELRNVANLFMTGQWDQSIRVP
jgi:hypothetical protein